MNLDQITQQYLQKFPGDFSGSTMQRQTPKLIFSTVEIMKFEHPELLIFNERLSEDIGLGKLGKQEDTDFLNAADVPSNIKTYATAYAGHQFGNWAGQLGDGRAIFAGEIRNKDGKQTEIQWKGAGATPYSRHADGRAVLRSSLREYLMSEAMFHLGVPTTRALSLSLSGEQVVRDMLYDGNAAYEKGAVMTRTSPSFLRFGHFELLSAQGEKQTLQQLADFVIENYFPEIDVDDIDKYALFFQQVAAKTADMIVEWYRVGFVHGVMNTDNMSILGLTIDYGPFSFLDEYHLNFTPNTTDLPGRRYAFGNQAKIAQWNLWQLANALFPLIKDEAKLETILNNFNTLFWKKHDEMMACKFGFDGVQKGDDEFFTNSQQLMQDLEVDYTLFFKQLETYSQSPDVKIHFEEVFYSRPTEEQLQRLKEFLTLYQTRLEKNKRSEADSIKLMKETNPKFILRNYLLFECINELNEGKKELLNKLLEALEHPYEEIYPEFSVKRPSKFDGETGCSTLSCSS
ncbi:YdiU family protein [Chryseobacterium sp. SNU WT5]|uniref:protein adenylyltransferase SelO n=1 Tax=Chryseobacterium sp. SNU WT5 TaxID=2594269 RepID=UPI00117E584E|nr:YdiU family protein [Chryseobacterium sp. SNU WT5]QDP85284.1 YdiU family protein [Chryseobacterium sp. SNU WT5]